MRRSRLPLAIFVTGTTAVLGAAALAVGLVQLAVWNYDPSIPASSRVEAPVPVAPAEHPCGPRPDVLFGQCIECEIHMAELAHDPGSVRSSTCTAPVLTDRCWLTSCIMRAKNQFGALVAQERLYYLGPGDRVVEAEP